MFSLDDSGRNLRELFGALGADLVIMLSAYFDESGTAADSLVTCVAGYVFEPEQCVRFDAEWNDVLNAAGIKRFHMVECAQRTGEFRGRSNDECDAVARQLIGIIKRRARIGIVASISEADFEQGDPGWGYVFCLNWCLSGVAAWINSQQNFPSKISYFFEAGHNRQGLANKTMEDFQKRPLLMDGARYHSHSFISKSDARPIQAADLLAWQWHREWVNRFGTIRRPRRRDLDALLKLPHIGCHMTEPNLRELIQTGSESEAGRRFEYIEPIY